MSGEEKKVIETVEGFIKYYKKNEQTGNRANLDVLAEEVMAIEFILNKYDVQQKELDDLKEIEQQHKTDNGLLRQELDMQIEHNKEIDYKYNKALEDLVKLEKERQADKEKIKELESDKEIKNKIIDRMAEYINKLDIDEDICTKNIINSELCNEQYSNCKECIKQYFENLAKESGEIDEC